MRIDKVKDMFDCIDFDEGDITFIRVDADPDKCELIGICGSTQDIQDFDLPSGKYIAMKAIEEIII
tara:strand:+ start:523 stop:720 length:198 start_codon:yes stop_codon:yes gene_type:complete